jgi:hypothetical protein
MPVRGLITGELHDEWKTLYPINLTKHPATYSL